MPRAAWVVGTHGWGYGGGGARATRALLELGSVGCLRTHSEGVRQVAVYSSLCLRFGLETSSCEWGFKAKGCDENVDGEGKGPGPRPEPSTFKIWGVEEKPKQQKGSGQQGGREPGDVAAWQPRGVTKAPVRNHQGLGFWTHAS